MKALVVAPQPFFSPRGTPLSVYYRTLITAELGVEVDLLTYGQGKDVDIPGVRIVRIPRFSMLGDVQVGPSFLKLYLDIFLFYKMIQSIITERYDFVHVHEEAIFFGVILKPIFGFKLVYDMHSSLPKQLTNFEFTRSKILISLFEWLERAGLCSADAVITISEDLYHYANEIISDQGKHVLIENSIFDPVRLASSSEEKRGESELSSDIQAARTGPANKRLVVYTGTLEPYQGIGMLLEAFRAVIEKVDDAFLLVAGGTPEQVDHYSDKAEKLDISNCVLFTGTVPKNQAAAYIDEASVVLSPRTTGGNTPLKIYELLASGSPVVATDVPSHTQVLDDDVAFLVEPTSDGLADGIVRALEEKEIRERKARQAQKLYQNKYSREQYEKKMKKILEVLR